MKFNPLYVASIIFLGLLLFSGMLGNEHFYTLSTGGLLGVVTLALLTSMGGQE